VARFICIPRAGGGLVTSAWIVDLAGQVHGVTALGGRPVYHVLHDGEVPRGNLGSTARVPFGQSSRCLEDQANASGMVRDVGKYMSVTRCRLG
jgi:hypothetical protein